MRDFRDQNRIENCNATCVISFIPVQRTTRAPGDIRNSDDIAEVRRVRLTIRSWHSYTALSYFCIIETRFAQRVDSRLNRASLHASRRAATFLNDIASVHKTIDRVSSRNLFFLYAYNIDVIFILYIYIYIYIISFGTKHINTNQQTLHVYT
jgi:hypothetical protein